MQETFVWDGLALIQRNSTNYINEPAVTGGNPILADNKVLFNDMLGTNARSQGQQGERLADSHDILLGQQERIGQHEEFFTGKPYIGGTRSRIPLQKLPRRLGKWQNADPLGYPDGWNQLAYCNNHVISSIDFLGAAEKSVTSDNIKYTWDWATSRLTGLEFIPDIEGIGVGSVVDVQWTVTVNWECQKKPGVCTAKGSFTFDTVVRVENANWIEYKPGPGIEIPNIKTVYEGLGELLAEFVDANIPMVAIMGPEDMHKLFVRPSDNTVMTNLKPVNHVCE
jgi:hypothetical protein